ncbi:MAG: MBL fold metallo-hydrolase [Immundisolibacteraceae bacterium]|nr:MBL fold metallo-hydrolase [Immundisolibacteraceae bacterium]
MRCASLGSGSRGNATVVEQGDTRLLVDCGFSAREARKRLARIEVEPDSLTALLVTHEHADHIAGVRVLARGLGLPVYLTSGTARAAEKLLRDVDGIREFNAHEPFEVGAIEVRPFPVPHDARDPAQFVFSNGDTSVGILTDAGHVTRVMVDALAAVDYLMLEFNHDRDMLWQGNYPQGLIDRVDSDYGHLNNQQSVALLNQLDLSRLSGIAALHLSHQNNSPDRVSECLADTLGDSGVEQIIACQEFGFSWFGEQ